MAVNYPYRRQEKGIAQPKEKGDLVVCGKCGTFVPEKSRCRCDTREDVGRAMGRSK